MFYFNIIIVFFILLSNEFIFFDSEKIIVIGFFILIYLLFNFMSESLISFFNSRRESLRNEFMNYYEKILKLIIIFNNYNTAIINFSKNNQVLFNSIFSNLAINKVFSHLSLNVLLLLFEKDLLLDIVAQKSDDKVSSFFNLNLSSIFLDKDSLVSLEKTSVNSFSISRNLRIYNINLKKNL